MEKFGNLVLRKSKDFNLDGRWFVYYDYDEGVKLHDAFEDYDEAKSTFACISMDLILHAISSFDAYADIDEDYPDYCLDKGLTLTQSVEEYYKYHYMHTEYFKPLECKGGSKGNFDNWSKNFSDNFTRPDCEISKDQYEKLASSGKTFWLTLNGRVVSIHKRFVYGDVERIAYYVVAVTQALATEVLKFNKCFKENKA
ncbi:hypothetical protein F7U66_18685 [Vibrio parahaemolyticus]|nr:hypothetical protein [Vibrio parahaemolyticus]